VPGIRSGASPCRAGTRGENSLPIAVLTRFARPLYLCEKIHHGFSLIGQADSLRRAPFAPWR